MALRARLRNVFLVGRMCLFGLVLVAISADLAFGEEQQEDAPSVKKGIVTKQQITLKSGEIITGVVIGKTEQKVIVATDNKTHTYRADQIVSILNVEVEMEEQQSAIVSIKVARKNCKDALDNAKEEYYQSRMRGYENFIKYLNQALDVAMSDRDFKKAEAINAEKIQIEELFKKLKSEKVKEPIKPIKPIKPEIAKNHPLDATKWGNHYYKVIEETVFWEDAQKTCAKLKGYLVIIDSKKENEFIMSLIESKEIKADLLWLGLSFNLRKNRWEWVDGTDLKYANWNRGQPGNPKGEPYVVLTNHHKGAYGVWHDTSNVPGHVKGFICEWDK